MLGLKRVKAVAVRGDQRTEVADPARVVARRASPARSFGPATAKYRELGTVANLLVFNRFHALPTRNFSGGTFENVEMLAEVDLGPARRLARNSCASCTIGCEHVYALGRPGVEKPKGVRLEYESLFALGPLCGVDDPEAVLQAARLCDDAGLDTISTGGTIAFLMECVGRGWVEGKLPGTGTFLRFGDGQAVLEAIPILLERRGELGELLGMGSRRAAERIGGDAPALAPHVKDWNSPAITRRGCRPWRWGWRSGPEGPTTIAPGRMRPTSPNGSGPTRRSTRSPARPSRPRTARADRQPDPLQVPPRRVFRPVRRVGRDARGGHRLGRIGGELKCVARRVVNLRKALNIREGWTRAEDTLPQRLLLSANEDSGRPPRRESGSTA
ncbi:MAG: aldehyde ferredoxin oxidoreductase C-terminal domain-containing protein [Isosphaeraceae bacterium]